MDLATIMGMLVSFGLIGVAVGARALDFLDVPSMLIVFGGTLGAALTHYPIGVILKTGTIIRKTLTANKIEPAEVLVEFMDYANRARREGILALESVVKSLDSAYLRKGMQLTVDGLEPSAIQSIMETEINNTESRHGTGIEFMNALAAYAPALGMIGTLIGLVQMLRTMDDPAAIGPSMAIALITTFYGAILANLIFLPIAGKLKQRSKEEIIIMEMQMEGILGIARGENPRIIQEKLTSFQPPKDRLNS